MFSSDIKLLGLEFKMSKKLEKLHLIESSHLNIAVNDDDVNDNGDDEHSHDNFNFSQSLSVLLRNY